VTRSIMTDQASEILKWLEDERLITSDQRRRLACAMDAGADLTAALQSVPIVEPMQYIRALHCSSRSETAMNEHVVTSRGVCIKGATRDEAEGVNVIELDLDPDLLPDPPSEMREESGRPCEQPVAEAVRVSDEKPWFGMETDISSYISGGVEKLPVHDLADDGGIELVRDLNGLLSSIVDESAGFRVCIEADHGARLWRFGADGRSGAPAVLDGDQCGAMMAHLRVLARIQPRAGGVRRGAFRARSASGTCLFLLESRAPGEAVDQATVRAVNACSS